VAVKPQWISYKLDKIVEKSCSDFLPHTSEVCVTPQNVTRWRMPRRNKHRRVTRAGKEVKPDVIV
jgi:hypothetical protein